MPIFTVLFLLFTFANIAVPGTSGFISEFLTFLGAMNLNPFVAISASIAIVLAPAYALWFFHKVSYGSFTNYLPTIYQDITAKELNLLLPLLFFTFLFGLYPQIIFEPLHLSCLSLLHLFIPAPPGPARGAGGPWPPSGARGRRPQGHLYPYPFLIGVLY